MGQILFLLHAHMPFVRHPEHERFLEETWYFEAVLESYLPLIGVLSSLERTAPSARLALSLSPTLLEMSADKTLNHRLLEHLEAFLRLAEGEAARTSGDPDFAPLAGMYLERAVRAQDLLKNRWGGSFLSAFQDLAGSRNVEMLTTAATHAYLPNLAPLPGAVRAQVRTGIRTFANYMGKRPSGLWLPECGYYEGLDQILAEEGVGYFFLSAHGLLHSRPRPSHGLYRPVRTPAGVIAFGREHELSMKVWSSKSGYPAHPSYRDFYRDAGFDLDAPHIERFVQGLVSTGRTYTGLKYHRITGRSEIKEPYRPEAARAQAEEDARDFAEALTRRAEEVREEGGFDPLFVLPFDAELFGHWWFEGPQWLGHFLRRTSKSPALSMALPEEFMARAEEYQGACPSLSSWGEGGYGHTWSDPGREGESLRIVTEESARLLEAIDRLAPPTSPDVGRALDQGLREMMLLQSSDWGFLCHKETAAQYARSRVAEYAENLRTLRRMAEEGNVDEEAIGAMERQSPLFRESGWADYCRSFE